MRCQTQVGHCMLEKASLLEKAALPKPAAADEPYALRGALFTTGFLVLVLALVPAVFYLAGEWRPGSSAGAILTRFFCAFAEPDWDIRFLDWPYGLPVLLNLANVFRPRSACRIRSA